MSHDEAERFCLQLQVEEHLDETAVLGFIAERRKSGYVVRGKPIRDLGPALRAWSRSFEAARLDCARDAALVRRGVKTRRVNECWRIAEREDIDDEIVEQFIWNHTHDNDWTSPNPATGLAEPIRDLSAVLIAFAAMFEADRRGGPRR